MHLIKLRKKITTQQMNSIQNVLRIAMWDHSSNSLNKTMQDMLEILGILYIFMVLLLQISNPI